MKLNELKQGMVCELRDERKIIIVNKKEYINEEYVGTHLLETNFNNDLTTRTNHKEQDIMKVFYGDKVVWERKESTFWVPEKGERYYFVRHYGDVERYKYEDDKTDSGILKTVLVFKTKEEAEKQLRKQQATIRVIKEIARLNEGWVPNWDSGDEKYYIETFFDDRVYKLAVDYVIGFKTADNNLYLKSRVLAEQLIETHEQDLKIMLEVE